MATGPAQQSDRLAFEIDGISMRLVPAPPVYAPGGPVAFCGGLPDGATASSLAAVAAEAAERGAVLTVVQCPVEARASEQLLLDNGYTFASSWYLGPVSAIALPLPTGIAIRTAVASDVPRILELGDRKRDQYEMFSPVFWKKSPTPPQEFAPFMTSQVESDQNIPLIAETAGEIHGFLIAQCRNPAEGYVDDYAIADDATDWPTVGAALLAEAGRLAGERGVVALMIVCGHADGPKRTAIESLGFVLRKNWLVKPI